MTATSNFKLEKGILTVSGVTPNCHVYEIEITDVNKARLWAQYLGYLKFSRLSIGAGPPRGRRKP